MAATDTTSQDGDSAKPWVGQAIKRKEDPRFITGRGRYIDDISVPGMLHVAFVRSPEAHAAITSIDTSPALEQPGVVAAFTGEQLAGEFGSGISTVWAPPGVEINAPDDLPLKIGEIKCVGDPVAVVVGTDRYGVVDAAEHVIVEYDPKPVVVDPEEALEEGSPLVWERFGTNKTHDWGVSGGDLEAGLAEADLILERRIVNHRTAGAAIEARGMIAEPAGDKITLTSSTQIPHISRFVLAGVLDTSEDNLRVIAPDVGGGFGTKLQTFPEEAVVCALARRLGRPVKWIETRSENLQVNHHGRDQIAYVKIGAKSDGTLTALQARFICDLGAYFGLLTPFIPELGFPVAGGCYKWPCIDLNFTGVFTNKFATDAIRGAGRPEMTHWVELCMDQLADELGMDSLELRRKNFIKKDEFPYETALGIVYDSGDYEGSLDRMLEMVDVEAFRREQAELRERGIHRGIGFSTYTEVCGLAPSRAVGPQGVGLQAAFWESSMVRVHPSGSATVYTGASPHGQGHDTGFAQIVADRIGADPAQVEVIHGDTDQGPFGWGTYGSRTLSVGGEAAARAAIKVQEKAKQICAALLEAAPEDIELADGGYRVKGQPDKSMTLAEISGAAHIPPEELPPEIEPGLEETSFYDPENFVFPFGAHACIVDVDVETGKVKVVRWVAVDDCGPAINPMLIDGQVHGGVAHGIGQALYEQIHYDAEGQLTTGSFVDYALPTAAELPTFETGPDRDPLAGQLARGEGDRGGGHDRRDAGGDERRDRRAEAARHHLPRHAAHPGADLGGGAGRHGWRGRERWRCSMIPAEFDYEVASDVDDAIKRISAGGEDAKALAGGHSLVPLMKLRLAAPTLLVDLGRLEELRGVERNGNVRIGALTTHAMVQDTHELGLLSAVAAEIADQQVRNRGTIGGSIAHADPASDMPAAMLVTESEMIVRGPSGERRIDAADMFTDYMTSALAPDELLTDVCVPDEIEDYEHGYMKFTRRAEDWAMVGVCVLVKVNDGSCEDVRIGLTNMGSTPLRASAAEEALRGKPLDADSIAAAAEQAAEGTDPPDDLNATSAYKRHLARVMTRRALSEAAGIGGGHEG